MKSKSFLGLFGNRRVTPQSQRRWPRGRRQPYLETLENRVLLTNDAPFILRVTPVDGSTVFGTGPTIAITFSEDVRQAEAQNTGNYLLFNSVGKSISIDSALYSSGTNQVVLTYGGAQGLTADRYSLFVRGDAIHDVDDGLPLAQAKQLVVANAGTGTVSVGNLPGDGTFQALSNYASQNADKPTAVALVDINGDGIPDLIVANSATNSVNIFLGMPGGRFTNGPTLTLPTGAKPSALVVTNLRGSGNPDIAVANADSDNVTVFLNNFVNNTPGTFSPGAPYAAGRTPVGIVAGNFDQSGRISLAVVNSNQDAGNLYDVTVLPADPAPGNAGKFLAPVSFDTGLVSPTSLAVGAFRQAGRFDLVVGASNGLRLLFNNSSGPGNFNFVQAQLLTATSISAVTTGPISLIPSVDIVATTKLNNGQVFAFQNVGGGFFGSPAIFNAGPNPTGVALADVNGDGKNDILVSNGSSSTSTGRSLSVLINQSGGTIVFAAPVSYTVDNNPVAVAVHLNSSGIVDLAATANADGNDVSVLLPQGGGVFRVSTELTAGAVTGFATAVAVGDLNGTHAPSFVVVSGGFFTPVTATILLNQGNGTFAPPVTINVGPLNLRTTGNPNLALADLTGRGILDVAITIPSDNTVTVLSNSGTGSFTPIFGIPTGGPLGAFPTGIAVGDFRRVGRQDIAVSESMGGVSVLLGNGDRTFAAPRIVTLSPGVSAVAVAAADFDGDGNLDLAVVDGRAAGNVQLLFGDGTGNFVLAPLIPAGDSPSAIAVGDLNQSRPRRSPDIVLATRRGNVNRVQVVLNPGGALSRTPASWRALTPVDVFTSATVTWQTIALTDINRSPFPSVVLTTSGGADNVVVLPGVGDGTFAPAQFYATSGGGSTVAPSFVAVSSDPFIRATSFNVSSNLVSANLIKNGTFQALSLAGEKGNLDGWRTFQQTSSHGDWAIQTGVLSPLSAIPVAPPPVGSFAAMLDEPDPGFALSSIPGSSLNPYEGTHVLYQDFTIPITASSVTLSFALQLLSGANFTDTTVTRVLDFFPRITNRPANQQVRVDIMDPLADLRDVGTGVLRNIFVTDPGTPTLMASYRTLVADLTPFRGRTVRLRIASVNNQAKLLVGLDNVQVQAIFTDTQPPSVNGLRLRNPGFGVTGTFGGNTTDPTIIGQVSDDGSPSNVAYVAFDINNTGDFSKFRVTNFDALGNFVTTLPVTLPGIYNVAVQVVDKAGNSSIANFSFNFQGPSLTNWQAAGPGPIRVSISRDSFSHISGKITSIALDPRDASGNVFYVGSNNGGVWKTTDGGSNWTPLTDFITDAAGNPVAVPIGGVAVAPSDPDTVYAATGVADSEYTSRAGVGVLKSTDGGKTWTLLGTDVFAGARISKIAVAKQASDGVTRVYVAVASGGRGPGVYRSTDGGATWINVLDPTKMFLDDGTVLGAGHALASVTDLVIDQLSFNQENLLIGLGNIGLVPASDTGGLWKSPNFGDSWFATIGGHDPKNSLVVRWSPRNNNGPQGGLCPCPVGSAALDSTKLPSAPNYPNGGGMQIGRVTIAQATDRPESEPIIYVLIGRPRAAGAGAAFTPSFFDRGQTSEVQPPALNTSWGLYKTKNGGLSWTHVMLRENVPVMNKNLNWLNLFTLGYEANSVGALTVDPTNPNIVYLGGSTRYTGILADTASQTGHESLRTHSLIRVDTSFMRDTDYSTNFGSFFGVSFENANETAAVFPNDGDDIFKAAAAGIGGILHNNMAVTAPEAGTYPDLMLMGTNPFPYGGTPAYEGEGVFWYDLQTTDSGGQNWSMRARGGSFFDQPLKLPDGIHALVFDPHGRLLVGTEGGLFRGTSLGFTYDTTSGGAGIMAVPTPPPATTGPRYSPLATPFVPVFYNQPTPLEQGMSFADLNGNLQISDQTSVAIDPVDRHALHSSQSGTGWATTTGQFPGSLQWTSTNTFIDDGLVAGHIRSGRRDPSAGPGTQSNVYRTFSFRFIGVRGSVQGGQPGTFQDVNQGLDLALVPAALLPPLVVNPTKLAGPNGTFFDEVMYGTNKVFESDNNAASWDQVANLLPNDAYTAMAFGPSGTDVFYVGTETGQVFVDLRDGGDGFPNRSAGLPGLATGGRINGITVDPKDTKTAYVMTGGTQDNHVFKTTDAGLTWTSVSAGLPKVPAYSMAIDPRPSPGAPTGKLFLGTDIGVYVSLDGGATWAKFGQGLPNVPAVDVQFDSVWETLAVATQGRGTFEVSTARFGPRVVSVAPPGPTPPGISALFVNFNQPMDPRTFTTDKVRIFNGPNGPITPLQIIDLDPFGDHMRFQITFVPQTSDGVYTISIAPTVSDLVGNPLDQDGNGINGEDPLDIFTTRFVVNSTDDGRIVTGFYHDLLGRTADTDGFLSFLGVIDSVRFQVLPGAALGFTASNEGRRARIFNPLLTAALTDPSRPDLYPHYLRRAAAGPEIDFWSQALNFGATPEAIITLIAASDEYYQQGLAQPALVGGIDSSFVDKLYLDVLGRPTLASQADPAGFNGFLGNLTLSEENVRRTAVSVIDHSSEYLNSLVNGFYTKYLGRPASPGELPNWIGQLQLGTLTDESLIAILEASDENFARRGGNNLGWLTGAFNDILGRAPDAGGLNFFLGQLQAGRSRFSVASQLLGSDEYRRNLVQSYFTRFLGRSADDGAISLFVGAMRLGIADEAIISIIVASGEYFQKQRGTATTQQALDVNWINAVYNDLLGRPADAGGGASFLAVLAAGERTARIGVVQILVGSNEYRANLIATAYQTYLGRPAGAAEIAIWQPLLQQPSTGPGTPNQDEIFLAIVTGSFEYFMRQRGPDNVTTNTTWITSLYRNILGRAPDAPGLDSHVNFVLSQYQTQRLNSATLLDTSAEYRQNLVNTVFKTYLRRAPLASEVTQRVTDLSNGLTDEQLISLLVSSVEYFQNPNLGGADNSKWLNQVFLDLLGRNRDASAQPLLDALNNNSLTRAGVVTIIMGGDEFGKRLISQFFTTYLGRAALPAEQTQFLASLRAGATDEQIIATLLASGEYARRPHAFP